MDKTSIKSECEVKRPLQYKLMPPEGGWGHFVTISLTLSFIVTVIPLAGFGMIFGNFLASVGDETSGNTLVNSVFGTVQNFTGLIVNPLFRKLSYRTIGMIGAFIFFIGCLGNVFVTSLFQMVITYGVLEGIGFGFIMPAVYTAFNSYFDKRKTVMMCISQAAMVTAIMFVPWIIQFSMENYGFRGTLALLAAVSLNTLVCMMVLQPVEWHLKKKPLEIKILTPAISKERLRRRTEGSLCEEVLRAQIQPLLKNIHEDTKIELYQKYISSEPRTSIISLDGRAMSVRTINKLSGEVKLSIWRSFVESMDMNLFKDPVYVNVALGLALGLFADNTFVVLLPTLLKNANLAAEEMTMVFTIHFGVDLAARIGLSIISAFFTIRNRYCFMMACFGIVFFRTAFTLCDTFLWRAVTAGCLGFMRTFIQTTLPLVISDEFPEAFSSAYSLFMVVCGVVMLLLGLFGSFLKEATKSDNMVVHMLNAANLFCAVSWALEMIVRKYRTVSEPKKIKKIENYI